MKEQASNKVVPLFPQVDPDMTPEEKELDDKITQVMEEQDGFIREMVMATTTQVDEMSNKERLENPENPLLVHMPIEAFLTSAATYLNALVPVDSMEQASALEDMIGELTHKLDDVTHEFMTRCSDNGLDVPVGLMFYGYINAAIQALREQRVLHVYHEITGDDMDGLFVTDEPTTGGNNDEN